MPWLIWIDAAYVISLSPNWVPWKRMWIYSWYTAWRAVDAPNGFLTLWQYWLSCATCVNSKLIASSTSHYKQLKGGLIASFRHRQSKPFNPCQAQHHCLMQSINQNPEYNYFDNVPLNICSIKLYALCHCERSEAVSWFARGLLRRKERSSQ